MTGGELGLPCPGCVWGSECTWIKPGPCPIFMRHQYGEDFESKLTEEEVAQLASARKWHSEQRTLGGK